MSRRPKGTGEGAEGLVIFCKAIVPETRIGTWASVGGMVCMRRQGHPGKHISLARAALIADGFCPDCGKPSGEHLCGRRFWGMP